VLPPHTQGVKANELALYYGFTGLWASEHLLHRRLRTTSWVALALVTIGLLLPRILSVAPPDIGPSYRPPWPAYPLSVRMLQLAVSTGVCLAALLGARVLLAAAERTGRSFASRQLGRRPVFLYAASSVALVVSVALGGGESSRQVLGRFNIVTSAALLLLAGYSLAWSITPTILRLIETRPWTLATGTLLSTATVLGYVVAVLSGDPTWRILNPLSPTGLIPSMAVFALATVGAAGVAAGMAELIMRVASYLGGLSTRLSVLGCVVVLLAGAHLFGAAVWPIVIIPSAISGNGRFEISFNLALIVVVTAALIHRLSRDLSSARAQFRAIAAGELPRSVVVAGREESSRLLERLAHFSSQLSKRPFLEQLSADIRARADQLRVAARQLNDTNAQRMEAERFAAIAGIVATASHELRNPVAQIAGNLPLIRSYVEATARNLRSPRELGGDGAHLLAKTAQQLNASGRDVEASARGASLVLADLNAISATSLRALEEIDLGEVIQRSVRLTPRHPGIRVHCDLEPVPPFTARAGELEQVVVNLIGNAIAAVAPEGTVLVRLRAMGQSVLLEVEDDGPGMEPDVLAHATEPFFTTKPRGQGSGLGLAIVSSIVASHAGALRIVSTPGSGTRVAVTLPLREGRGERLEHAEAPAMSRQDVVSAQPRLPPHTE
jgi:signal transduction histidine kinase